MWLVGLFRRARRAPVPEAAPEPKPEPEPELGPAPPSPTSPVVECVPACGDGSVTRIDSEDEGSLETMTLTLHFAMTYN